MKDGFRVVDADAHVIEPDDLWARYFDESLRDRAPRHLNRAFAIQAASCAELAKVMIHVLVLRDAPFRARQLSEKAVHGSFAA